jgi:hypothetical protein
MAVTWTTATLNAQADEDAARCAYGSLHTASPGSTGANEATGGSPAYARQALAFEAAGDEGPLGASLQPATDGVAWASATFDLPTGTFSHYGYWSASTGGTFHGGGALSASVVMSANGEQVVSFRVGPNA